MAYEVTATRRRPKTLDELAGQEFVAATLKRSIETGRIAHAYLFSGPRGCGKTSAARILARSLNCEKGPTATPCGVCPSCLEISRGASLDIIEIDGASNNGVESVRQIKDEVLFPPNGGRYKVYIIDEVHMLSTSAFNALLKTIEEPPPYIVFIFATTEIHKVPATIKSRCQQFSFRLIPIEMIRDILKDTCTEMDIQAEDEALFWIAKESTGSLRDAYTLFDQVASFSDGHIRAALIREKLGLVGLDKLNGLAEACAANDTPGAFKIIDELLDAGISIEQFIIDLAGYYRSLLLLKNGVNRESLLGYSPDRFSALVPEKLDSIHLERALSLLLDLYRDIRYSLSPRFELETAVSKLSWLDRWISPPELRAAVAGARDALGQNVQGQNVLGRGASGGGAEGGIGGPLAGNPPTPAGRERSDRDAPFDTDALNSPTALSDAFKRHIAARNGAQERNERQTDVSEDVFDTEPAPVVVVDSGPVVAEPTGPEQPLHEAFPPAALQQIREAVIGGLKRERGFIASGLEKSLAWTWNEDRLNIPAPAALEAEILRKEAAFIREVLSTKMGRPVTVEISVQNTGGSADTEPKAEIPPQVELVRRLFRGTIVKTHENGDRNEHKSL
ncbi:DNA polymerase III subunit gamma/tau [Spirochaetia bacterium]|nr:DNA polymerase III subunit gamma/tau [Spirochaetia bacterium]